MSEASSASDGGDQEHNTSGPDDAGHTSDETGANQSVLDASTQGAEQDVKTAASSSTADGTPSETEGDKGAKEPESMVEALEKAVEQDKQAAESPPASSEDQKSEDKPEPAKEAAKEGKPEDGDDKLPPFHEHLRWKQVMAERSELKEQIVTLTAEKEQSAEAVEAIDRLEGYLREHNLTTDEHNTMLHIGALMRNDPVKALEALTPYYSALLEVTGTILPADIQQAVNEGLVTEDYGKQLAKHRAGESIATQQMELQTSQHETATNEQLVDGLSQYATTWEHAWAASDPDYSKKAELVQEGIELRLRQGAQPADQEAIVKMCEEEKSKVEARMRAFMPKTQSITPSPGSSGGPSSLASPAPTTMIEAMEQSVAGAYE